MISSANKIIVDPVFIIGSPRSGSSLIRVIVNAHPEILIPPECGFAMWLFPDFKDQDFMKKDIRIDFANRLFKTRKFETWHLNTENLKSFLIESDITTYAEMVDSVYRFYGYFHKIDFNRWGDKNNFYLNHINEIDKLFPSAQFIHIVRDGRDVASSYIDLNSRNIQSIYKPILPESIEEIAIDWIKNNNRIIESLSEIAENRKLLIRYEDVILDFENTIKTVADFLGIEYDNQMKNFQNSNYAIEPEEFMQWKRKLYSTLDPSSIGRHNTDLSLEQIEIFKKIAGDFLRLFGYSL